MYRKCFPNAFINVIQTIHTLITQASRCYPIASGHPIDEVVHKDISRHVRLSKATAFINGKAVRQSPEDGRDPYRYVVRQYHHKSHTLPQKLQQCQQILELTDRTEPRIVDRLRLLVLPRGKERNMNGLGADGKRRRDVAFQ